MSNVTKFEDRKNELQRRAAQRAGLPEGTRDGQSMMTRGGPATSETLPGDRSGVPAGKLGDLLQLVQRQNAAMVQEISNQRRAVATLAARFEGALHALFTKGLVETETVPKVVCKLRPEDFQAGMGVILGYDREFGSLMRIKDMNLRTTRLILWNHGRSDMDRIPIRPVDAGILEWLLEPSSGLTLAERQANFTLLDGVEDRDAFDAALLQIPVPPADLSTPTP